MKKTKLQSINILVLFTFLVTNVWAQTKPISLNPENPHYFSYQGKPSVLITSGEHYGAVMNPDFDLVRGISINPERDTKLLKPSPCYRRVALAIVEFNSLRA